MASTRQKIPAFLSTLNTHLIVLILSLAVSACSFAPGMQVQNTLWGEYGPEVIAAPGIAGAGVNNFIEVIPITDEIIDALSAGEYQSPVVPNELLNSSMAQQPYKIGINDVLSIVVWGQSELVLADGENGVPFSARQVKSDGTIFFPYAGTLHVLGKTRQEIRHLLVQKLSRYFQEPQVDVGVEHYNSQKVVLNGAFNQPITIPLQGSPLTLDQAVALAGGIAPNADSRNLRLTRNGEQYRLNYHHLVNQGISPQVVLQDGDSVHMPINQSKAYIVGEVGQPKSLPISAEGLTLTDALGSAGGLSPSTSGGGVYIVRRADSAKTTPQVFRLSAKSPAAFLLAGRFDIQPQDVIFVGASDLTRWNRVISQLFPSTSLIDATRNLSGN